MANVRQLPIKTAGGLLLPLEDIFADIRQQSGRYKVLQAVLLVVTLLVCMDDLEKTVLGNVKFSAELYPEFTGATIEQAKPKEELLILSLLVMTLVMMLVYIAIGSFRNVILMLVNLPFALVGGVIAVLVTGGNLSVALWLVLSRFSVLRYAIQLCWCRTINFWFRKKDYHGIWMLAIQGAQERQPSILMTALVMVLAMLPIAINSDNPGREIMEPMAAIIIGGLASSTILNLLIVPTIMLKFGSFNRPVYPLNLLIYIKS